MSAHRFIKFTRLETQLRDAAEKALANATSSIAEKRHARRVLADTLCEAQGRLILAKARRALGPKPSAAGPELDAWRDAVKRIKCEAILDDTRSSLAQTRLAERTLEELRKKELLRGTRKPERVSRDTKHDPRAPVTDIGRPVEEQAAIDRFLAQGEAPEAKQGEPRIVPNGPLRPASPNSQLFCELHQTALATCGCANQEICPLCLISRQNCGHR